VPKLELYENKVLSDMELPVQLFINHRDRSEMIFASHWHEHLELQYIAEGCADMHYGQKVFEAKAGDLMIANCGELHSGFCTKAPYTDYVIIFNPADLSEELAKKQPVFTPLIANDPVVTEYVERIFTEAKAQQTGYKQMCRALVTELLVYLCRHYVRQSLPEKDSIKRRKALERMNPVLWYIEQHYSEHITVAELAGIACLSEDRFGHLFREGAGMPPMQYLNEVRLHKAMILLQSDEYTVTAVAEAVGFRDYNHFGRLFRKHYGCTPGEARRGYRRLSE